jgi:hypothetical protein
MRYGRADSLFFPEGVTIFWLITKKLRRPSFNVHFIDSESRNSYGAYVCNVFKKFPKLRADIPI